MATFIAILDAIAAVPAFLSYVEKFCSAVSVWYIQHCTAGTLSLIADAANLQMKATNREERFASTDVWQQALKRDRMVS